MVTISSRARFTLKPAIAFAIALSVAQACGGQSIETTCTPDEMLCMDSCAALWKDPMNCGACGDVCAQGLVCFSGVCTTSCGGGTTPCGQSCVDLTVDRANCGGCNIRCAVGEACADGACSSTCLEAQTFCVLDGGGAYCANTNSDNKNCGSCGVACPPQLVCANGLCSSTCAPNQSLCLGDAGRYCTDINTDESNCGACGSTCDGKQVCNTGICEIACAATQTRCFPNGGDGGLDAASDGSTVSDPYCANLDSDNVNCGNCGTVCGFDTKCANGKCIDASCVSANGLNWCVNDIACGEACTQVCADFGLSTANATTWYNAQNTTPLCQNISMALGLGSTVVVAWHTYACLEDSIGTHSSGSGLIAPLYCSTDPSCPTSHLTMMDENGDPCGAGSRRSICPCQ